MKRAAIVERLRILVVGRHGFFGFAHGFVIATLFAQFLGERDAVGSARHGADL